MRRYAARLSVAASAGLAALLLSSCAGTAGANSPSASGAIEVVTSTNVYGDIVKAVGGDKVNVNAIITKTSQDPHSYEASAQDKLVIWWPPQMRVEPGPAGERADYQTVSLER